MQQRSPTTAEFVNIQTLVRCALRIAVLCICATFGQVGFIRSFAILLLMSAFLCIIAGIIRRETILGATVTAWDEAAIHGALGCLALMLSSSPDI